MGEHRLGRRLSAERVLLENAARATCEEFGIAWSSSAAQRGAHVRLVLAVLRAVREPTPGMIEAAGDDAAHPIWQEMIDALLEAS